MFWLAPVTIRPSWLRPRGNVARKEGRCKNSQVYFRHNQPYPSRKLPHFSYNPPHVQAFVAVGCGTRATHLLRGARRRRRGVPPPALRATRCRLCLSAPVKLWSHFPDPSLRPLRCSSDLKRLGMLPHPTRESVSERVREKRHGTYGNGPCLQSEASLSPMYGRLMFAPFWRPWSPQEKSVEPSRTFGRRCFRMFGDAWRDELIPENPVARVKVPAMREIRKERVILTDEELAQYLRVRCRVPRDSPLLGGLSD